MTNIQVVNEIGNKELGQHLKCVDVSVQPLNFVMVDPHKSDNEVCLLRQKKDSMLSSLALSEQIALIVFENWVQIMLKKEGRTICASDLALGIYVQVKRDLSSTMARKYLYPSMIRIWNGPHISIWIKSKISWLKLWLETNGNFFFLFC